MFFIIIGSLFVGFVVTALATILKGQIDDRVLLSEVAGFYRDLSHERKIELLEAKTKAEVLQEKYNELHAENMELKYGKAVEVK